MLVDLAEVALVVRVVAVAHKKDYRAAAAAAADTLAAAVELLPQDVLAVAAVAAVAAVISLLQLLQILQVLLAEVLHLKQTVPLLLLLLTRVVNPPLSLFL